MDMNEFLSILVENTIWEVFDDDILDLARVLFPYVKLAIVHFM